MADDPEWKSYERATRAIFQKIVNQDLLKTVDVQHNVTVRGRTTAHQIDVLWVFEVGGVQYRNVVQCKDWNKRIEQVHVLAFKAVLDDIPGRPQGFMVSRKGFQAGAIDVAKGYDIALYELRPPDNENMAGRISSVVLHGTLFSPRIMDLRPMFDTAWVRAEGARRGIPKGTEIPYSGTIYDTIVDEQDCPIGTFETFARAYLMPTNMMPIPRRTVRFEFPMAAFLPTPTSRVPRLKLAALEAEVEQTAIQHETVVSVDDFVALVLKQVGGDNVVLYTKQGDVVIPSGTLSALRTDRVD